MSISTNMLKNSQAIAVSVTDESLAIGLADGRTITVPLEWFPRLLHGNFTERKNWKLIGNGAGVHWEDLDEDISVEGLLAGHHSEESQESFKKWLKKRSKTSV